MYQTTPTPLMLQLKLPLTLLSKQRQNQDPPTMKLSLSLSPMDDIAATTGLVDALILLLLLSVVLVSVRGRIDHLDGTVDWPDFYSASNRR